MQSTEQRIDRLERLVTDLDTRIAMLESPAPSRAVRPAPAPLPASVPAVAPRPPEPAPRAAATPPRPPEPFMGLRREGLEDLLGGRVLAWVGGLAVTIGIVFLFALGISNGWISEAARLVLGAAGSAGLLGLGVWLHESKARTDAALAAVATGISGLFVTVTVAAQVYELVPQLPAAVLAIGVGAIATVLALRWESRGIAALGILGALGAPVLTGVAGDGGTMVILFAALASATGVLIWQRWDWLALAAFLIATPQWVAYIVMDASALQQVAVLVGFGVLGVAVAVGHEVRIRAARVSSSSAYLLALNAIVVSAAGWGALTESAGDGSGHAWLAGMAVAHIAVGLFGGRVPGLSDDLRLLSLVIGTVIADVAFGLIAHGPVLAIGWAATGVGFTVLMSRSRTVTPRAAVLTQAGLGGHLALSLVSAIVVSNPVEVLNGYESLSAAGAAAVAALAAACLVSGRIAEEGHPGWRIVLDATGLAAIAVLTALSLDGLQLVLAWTAEVVALTAITTRTRDAVTALGAYGFLALAAMHVMAVEAPLRALETGLPDPAAGVPALAAVAGCLVLIAVWMKPEPPELATATKALAALTVLYGTAMSLDGLQLVLAWTVEIVALAAIARRTGDEVARYGALGFLAFAALHAIAVEAPPVSLVTGLAEPAAAVAALSAVAGCLVLLAAWTDAEHGELQLALRAMAALALLYLASTGVVTPFESDSAVDSTLLNAHQQGQMVLSVFWGLVGVGTIVVGLRRDLGVIRMAGLALLGVTVTKLFLFDLATLTSVYRVVSFVGLGLLLLCGGLVWQRLRPQALGDLRETPAGVR